MRQLKIQKSITNRSSEALDKYLVEIGRVPMISVDEEIELAQKIRKGGKEGERAKEKLVMANLRFVVSVAKQYQHQGLSLTDLIDEGNIGLVKAAEKFDETRGFKFISYAVWWIRQSILQAIAGRAVSSGCRSIRWVPSQKSTQRFPSLSRRTSAVLPCLSWPSLQIWMSRSSTRPSRPTTTT